MVAEAVWSQEFRRTFEDLDEGKRIEVDFAIYAIEEDPRWRPPSRFLAPPGSGYSGFIADMSVDGYAIIYRVVDQGAAVELWYLHELPGWKARRSRRDPKAPVPMM